MSLTKLNVNELANGLTLNKANLLLAQQITFVCACIVLIQINNPFASCCQASYVFFVGLLSKTAIARLNEVTYILIRHHFCNVTCDL